MYIDIITIIVAGFAAAGIVLILNRLTGRRLPRWAIPAGAGAGMILMSLTNEYRWYPRTLQLLPAGFEVVSTAEHRALYSPWTYAVPMWTASSPWMWQASSATPASPICASAG